MNIESALEILNTQLNNLVLDDIDINMECLLACKKALECIFIIKEAVEAHENSISCQGMSEFSEHDFYIAVKKLLSNLK